MQTNILGASNVLDAAVDAGALRWRVIVLSTDKAVYPINAMGMSKASSMEKITGVAKSRTCVSPWTIQEVSLCDTLRYGQCYGVAWIGRLRYSCHRSRSVRPLTVTDPADDALSDVARSVRGACAFV